MKLGVTADANGAILAMYNPDALKTAQHTTVYVPQPGEKHYFVDLPAELEGKSLSEIATSHRLNLAQDTPAFESLHP